MTVGRSKNVRPLTVTVAVVGIIGALLLAVGGALLLRSNRTREVAFHEAQKELAWAKHERTPNDRVYIEQYRSHRMALVSLGAIEKRSFNVNTGSKSNRYGGLVQMLLDESGGRPDVEWSPSPLGATVLVTVYARPQEMAAWESRLAEFNGSPGATTRGNAASTTRASSQ